MVNDCFRFSAAAIFTITGLAKIISAFGSAAILAEADPLLHVSFRHLMIVAAVVELAVAATCAFSQLQKFAVVAIAWLASILIVYRIGLFEIGWHRGCPCLGNLTDAIHISPQLADNTMKVILAYLFIGSCGILLREWLKSKKQASKFEPNGESH